MPRKGKRQTVIDAETVAGLANSEGSSRSRVIDQILQGLFRAEQPPAQQEPKCAPQKAERADRRISFTLPNTTWKEAILDIADQWEVRPTDFVTFCVSYTMHAIKSGKLPAPLKSEPTQPHHRAGENLDLPWSPRVPPEAP